MTYIKDSTINEMSALAHRTTSTTGGRNTYSKGHRHYTRSAQKKMPRDTIPEDYEQPEAPENNAFAVALQAALAAKNTES